MGNWDITYLEDIRLEKAAVKILNEERVQEYYGLLHSSLILIRKIKCSIENWGKYDISIQLSSSGNGPDSIKHLHWKSSAYLSNKPEIMII